MTRARIGGQTELRIQQQELPDSAAAVLEALPLTCDWVPWSRVMRRLQEDGVAEGDAKAARDHLEQDGLLEAEPKKDGESLVRLAPAMFADSQDVPPWWR